MNRNARRTIMGLMIAATLVWALITLFVFVASGDVSSGWLLTTILLYAALFVFALLLLFLAAPEDTAFRAAPDPSASVLRGIGPAHEQVFATRRGVVEIDRTQGTSPEILVSEKGRTVHLAQAEAALDRLEPAPDEAAPLLPASPEVPPETRPPRPSRAPRGTEVPA